MFKTIIKNILQKIFSILVKVLRMSDEVKPENNATASEPGAGMIYKMYFMSKLY